MARPRDRFTLGTQGRRVPRPERSEGVGGAPLLEERRLDVLRAIVEGFVLTNEPVGSKAVAERGTPRRLTGDGA